MTVRAGKTLTLKTKNETDLYDTGIETEMQKERNKFKDAERPAERVDEMTLNAARLTSTWLKYFCDHFSDRL